MFLTDGVTASARYAPTGEVKADAAIIAIAYDAGTHSYTITSGSRSQTFLPADKDLATSGAAQLNIYKRTTGNVTDSLTLTNAGSAGAFTYQYVAGGYWQRTDQRSDGVVGTFDAFTYGLRTPDSVRPRLGYASYAIDVLGLEAERDYLYSITGTGQMFVDFVGGDIGFSGQGKTVLLNHPWQNDFYFHGAARLTSGTTGFTGTMHTNFFEADGPITGGFFGPGAEEVGATFRVAATGGIGYSVGTLTGRQTPGAGPTLATLATPTDFSLNGDSLHWGLMYAHDDVPETVDTDLPFLALSVGSIHADPLAHTYSIGMFPGPDTLFTAGDIVPAETTAAVRTYRHDDGTISKTLRMYQPVGSDGTLLLSYTGFADYEISRREAGYEVRDRILTPYGLMTRDPLPQTGTGNYTGVVIGSAYGTNARYDLRGTAAWSVAFDSGAIRGTLSPVLTPVGGAPAFDAGTLAIHGSIYANAENRIDGVLTQKQAGGPDFSGRFLGNFFGPVAQEAAFAFEGAFPRTRPDGLPDPLTVIGVAAGKRQ